jgi:hypothetical protein
MPAETLSLASVVGSTKSRRRRPVAIGSKTRALIEAQRAFATERARSADGELPEAAFMFSNVVDSSVPWRPNWISHLFAELRSQAGVSTDIKFKQLRKFMETYGQDLGFSLAQVPIRAGHDPAVASRHYTGRVAETDRALAEAIEGLL